MEDLHRAFEMTMQGYSTYNEEMPVLQEFVLGYRWLMAVDTKNKLSLALRVGKEKSAEEYESLMRSMIGKTAEACLKEIFSLGDSGFRVIAVALLNLLSKPFNTQQRLLEKGINRREGLNFPYDVSNKKVGIVGYGLYNNFFLGKCFEFHAFDLRSPKEILNAHIQKDTTKIYPSGIVWHLGKSATEFPEALAELDVVVMTGCTIVNDTYRDILKACNKAEIRGIYGPSCELCPEYLFNLGYNYIFSASVNDKEPYFREVFAPRPAGNDLSYMEQYELTRIG